MGDLKIEKEFIYNKIYESMSIIYCRRKLIKKTIHTNIRTDKF